jgi:hypothetical protein
MLLTRQLVRLIALALPLTIAAYPQAMVHYGAAVTAGSAVGAAAGKKTSDALTKVMNGAAAAGQTSNSADVAAAEAKNSADAKKAKDAKGKDAQAKGTKPAEGKPSEATKAADYKSSVKPASMPPAAEAAPSPFVGTAKPAKPISKDAQLIASSAHTVSPIAARPLARSRRGTSVAPVEQEPILAAAPAAPGIETPLSMQLELASFRPILEPMTERMQRITAGNSREDLKRILGAPASKVTIPADRDVSEIYYYQEKGRPVATIRLEAGEVTKVSIDSM